MKCRWVEFDPVVGSNIRKTRPGIIVSNNAANRNLSPVIVVPLTRNPEQVYPMMAALTRNFGRIATQFESNPLTFVT